MDNRTRKNQLKIYLTDEEKEIFEKKMKLAKQYPILLENVY